MTKQKWRLFLVGLLLLLPILYVTWAQTAIHNTAKQEPTEVMPYMIILGAGLRGETMSLSLLYRMETALDYLKQHPDVIAIVSGGQGPGETATEASVMRNYLLEHGIESERIIAEDRSTNTKENIRYSTPLMSEQRALIVTNDFHAYRAKMLAQRQGLAVETLSAPTPKVVQMKLLLREYIAITKSLIFDW